MGAGPASAKTPCWKVLINDWYDGRIDKTYPIPCYQQALRHLPEDVQTYSSARDDIRRALQERIQDKKRRSAAPAGKKSGGDAAPPPPATKPKGPGPGGKAAGGAKPKPAPTVPESEPEKGRRTSEGGPITKVFTKIGPKHADSVPIPLIVLGSIALLLLAAGTATFVAKRIQARRVPVRPNPRQ